VPSDSYTKGELIDPDSRQKSSENSLVMRCMSRLLGISGDRSPLNEFDLIGLDTCRTILGTELLDGPELNPMAAPTARPSKVPWK
jgi:hypothetical protein